MLGSKSAKFLKSILNRQVSSFSIFVSFFVMTHNVSVNFRLIHFLLWTIGSHNSNFDTFKCSGKNLPNSCHFPSNKSVFLQILYHSSMSWEITPLYFFSSNNIYFVQKKPIKVKIFETWKFLRFLRLTFKCSGQNLSNSLCQFWKDKLIPLQILYPSLVSWKRTSMYFLAQTIYTLLKRSPLKWNFWDFWVLRSKFLKFLLPIFKRQLNSSPNFVSFFSFMKDNFSVPFQLKQYILCSKGAH